MHSFYLSTSHKEYEYSSKLDQAFEGNDRVLAATQTRKDGHRERAPGGEDHQFEYFESLHVVSECFDRTNEK